MSAGFISSKGKKFKIKLKEQYNLTDQKIETYNNAIQKLDYDLYPNEIKITLINLSKDLATIPVMRKKVQNLNTLVS